MVEAAPPPSSSGTSWAEVPFGEFLHLLRRNGFAIGLRHYARMMTLLESLGPDCPPDRLRSLLAPIFATTADQQQRFHRLFDQWFPMFAPAPADAARTADSGSSAQDLTTPGASSRRGVVKRRRIYLPALAAVAVVSLVAMSWWAVSSRVPETATPVEAIAPTPDAPTVTPVAPVVPTQPAPAESSGPALQVDPQLIRVGVAFLILVGFIANEWRHYRRRQIVLERQRRERPPLVWPIRVESASTPLVESWEFLTAARRLRERQTGERERLDLEATIAATIRAQGRPVLHYVKETRPPEYLILIERASARDHQARLYHHLMEHLAAEGVHAVVYWCDEDPRICESVIEGTTATLVELRHKFPAHRLLMFGTGDGLIDPITGRRKAWVSDAVSWPDRALLTPEPPEAWGARELALAGHMIVLPGSLGGLQAAIDHFQIPSRAEMAHRRQRSSRVPEPDVKDAVRAIKSYLGPRGLQWVCACAVYPDLQWHLTLHLGMLPELGGAIDDRLLVKLVRLPWFREGAIPDEARAVLLRVIEPEVERAARRVIIALLERNPAPPQSIASSRFELDLVVQKFALEPRLRAHRVHLAKIARQAPRERVLTELAVLRMTEGDPGSTVAMRLPARLRDIFFQGGVSVLGLTSGARSLVAVALIAGVLLVRPGEALPDESLATVKADSAQAAPQVQATTAESTPAAIAPTGQRDSATLARASDSTTVPSAVAQPGRVGDSLVTATRTLPGDSVAPVTGVADSRGRDSTSRADSSGTPAPAAPPPASVTIGASPSATLIIGGQTHGVVTNAQPVRVAAGESVRIALRLDNCTPWDTTMTIVAGANVNLGTRTMACAAPTPDPAVINQLVEQAISATRARLAGRWTALDKAPVVTFGSPQQQARLANAIRDYSVTGLDVALRNRVGVPAVTEDSVFLTGQMRFQWRSGFGAPQQLTAEVEAALERTPSGPQLRRLLLLIR